MNRIMTADEITQLLHDRDIVLLFNEDVLCPEREELTNLLKNIEVVEFSPASLEKINIPTICEQEKNITSKVNDILLKDLPSSSKTPEEEQKLNSVLNVLDNIKNSTASHKIILFEFGIIDLFRHLLFEQTIAAFKQYDLSSETIVKELKNQLEYHYAQRYPSFNNKSFDEIKSIMSKVDQWDEFVSAILQCVNIRTINYHPQNPQAINEYCMKMRVTSGVETGRAIPFLSDRYDSEDYARELLYRDALEYVLTKKINGRYSASDYRPPVCSTLQDYLYATSRLVLDSNVIENVVEREMQLNEKRSCLTFKLN